MTSLQWVERYRSAGRVPLPIPVGTKKCIVPRWNDPATKDFPIAEGDNLAWRLDDLVDYDSDCPEAILIAAKLLPTTGARWGRPAANGPTHHAYLAKLPYKKWTGPDGLVLFEQRSGTGHYTLVPPSGLPANHGLPAEALEWLGDTEPTTPDEAGLERSGRLVAVATLLARALGPNGFGHDARLEVAGFLLRLGVSEDEAIEMGVAISVPCTNTELEDVDTTVRSTARALKDRAKEVSGGPALAKRIGDKGKVIINLLAKWLGGGQAEDSGPVITGLKPRTDAGDAEFFAERNKDRLRFDHRRGRWLLFGEHIWAPQTDGEVTRLALESMRARQAEALTIEDYEARKAYLKYAVQGESQARLLAMLNLAKSTRPLADAGDKWDLDPWLLGVKNGIVDLRLGTLRPGTPEDRITMTARYGFYPDAKAPLWEATIQEIFKHDDEMIGFSRRAWGYSITGDCREECLFLCHGDGANGKGTTMNTIGWVMGDYADDVPFQTLEQKDRSSIPNDVAKINGKRIVTASETAEASRLNESRIKSLTGRDPVTARFLHQEFFTFQPVAKFWLAANHKPEIKDDSPGFWRRIHLLPFEASFVGREDKTLKDALRAECEGILAELVRGAVEWQRVGLQPPTKVTEATAVYREESEPLSMFFDSECVLHPEMLVQSSKLFNAYVRWASNCGIRDNQRINQRNFSQLLKKKFEVEEHNRQTHYRGIGLRDNSSGGNM